MSGLIFITGDAFNTYTLFGKKVNENLSFNRCCLNGSQFSVRNCMGIEHLLSDDEHHSDKCHSKLISVFVGCEFNCLSCGLNMKLAGMKVVFADGNYLFL